MNIGRTFTNTAELCSQQSLIEILFPNWPDEHVEEVDEGKLDEGGEDSHEAHDDEHVEGGGVGNLQRISTFNILLYYTFTSYRIYIILITNIVQIIV